jgi:hypothetical protein
MRRFAPFSFVLVCVAALVGCDLANETPLFDGQRYRTKLSKEGERHLFQVTASPASASLAGAAEAARYEATRYCVTNFGSSDIIWSVGPDQDLDDLPVTDDRLVLRGACPQ